MTAALAAADAVRIADAGALVASLRTTAAGSADQCQCRSDQPDCPACLCWHAATLITTLRARLSAVEAARDTARADALREAASVARRVEIGVEMYGRTAQALACAAAILALIPDAQP